MADIEVAAAGTGEFAVAVTDGAVRTEHRVTVPAGLGDRLGLPGVDAAELVRASFGFLLEREPATAILRTFALTDITRFFPDYPDEIRRRLG